MLSSAVSGGECSEVCPNRESVTIQYNQKYCQLKECPADKPLLDYFGACHSCDEEINFVVTNREDCNICPNRWTSKRFDGGYHCSICGVAGTKYANMPLLHYHDVCYSCDTTESVPQYSIETPYRCANVCPNRYLDGNNCIRSECTEDKKLKDVNNQCYECNIASPINVGGDKEKCDACINRKLDGLYCVIN